VRLVSRSFVKAKCFMQGGEPWQEQLWHNLNFYDTMNIPLTIEPPNDQHTRKVPNGEGTNYEPVDLLSDTDEENEPPANAEPQMEEPETATEDQIPEPDYSETKQHYITSRISYKRKANPDYRERMRIYGTNKVVPSHYFDMKPTEIEHTMHVIAVLDWEEIDNIVSYHCLCDMRAGTETICQNLL
jgi:hypothetical protein